MKARHVATPEAYVWRLILHPFRVRSFGMHPIRWFSRRLAFGEESSPAPLLSLLPPVQNVLKVTEGISRLNCRGESVG
jgi:hypothetical protein